MSTLAGDRRERSAPSERYGLSMFLRVRPAKAATRRSECAAICKNENVNGLITALNRKADTLTGTAAKSF
jgi:hypothetical protein